MGLSTKVGSFNTGTGALNSTVVISDVGFQPKVIFFWWNGRTGTVDASGRGTHQRGFGVAVSSTDRRYATSLSQDTPTSMVTNTMQGNAACIGITTTGDLIDGLMDVSSIDAGGFTLIVDDVFVASYRVHYLALGGTDITNVATGQFTGNSVGVTGNQDITTVGFQPNFVSLFSTAQASANNTVRADSRMMISVANATGSAVWSAGSNDGAATSQAMSYCKTGEFISHFNSGLTGLDDRATFTGFLSNGFNVNWTTVTVGGSINFFVAIAGISSSVGNLTTQTDTTTPIVKNGFGFSPKAALLVSAGRAESTANTPTDDDEWSMGAFTSTTARAAMSIADDDAAGTAVVGTGVSHDEVYQNLAAATGAVEGEMDVQSVDSDGFTMIMDDADPVASCVWYAAFGQAPLTQSISGGLTLSGTLSKRDNKTVSGGVTSSGSVNKFTSKSFSGTLSSIVGTIAKTANKSFAGTLTSSGALLSSRLFIKILAGAITFSGAIAKQINKSFSGITTSSGALAKLSSKIFTGSLTPSGSIVKSDRKTFSGAVAPSGSITKTSVKPLSGAVTSAGVLVKQDRKSLSGSITSSGSISKQSNKLLSGAVTSSGSLLKSIRKFFSGVITMAGDLVADLTSGATTYFKTLAGTLTSSGSVSKSSGKTLAGSITPSGVASKAISKGILGVINFSGILNKQASKAFAGVTTFSGALSKSINKNFSGTLDSIGTLNKQVSKLLSGELTFSGAVSTSVAVGNQVFQIALGGVLELSGVVTKTTSKYFTGALTSSGILKKVKNFVESLSKIYIQGTKALAVYLEGSSQYTKSITRIKGYYKKVVNFIGDIKGQ